MFSRSFVGLTVVFAALAAATSACDRAQAVEASARQDAEFAALQERGEQAMGVDQYTSTHRFDALADGGRIELQRDVDDPTGVDEIRRHLAAIATAFTLGDFSTPAFVHVRDVPGADVMAAKRDRIEYIYSDLPRGGELRIVTNDPEVLKAIHQFMAFQREDHHAGGVVHGEQSATPHGSTHDGQHPMPHGVDHQPGTMTMLHGPNHVRPDGQAPHGMDHVRPSGQGPQGAQATPARPGGGR